ncbi:hypothetical protein EZV62_006991 [Acer yangbiense]|uniref:AAA+ ATPase domain-containing protein n=1 Tax=Acer yangbiense TaxID=1000413 RepID=A0A5C7IBC9_9ROSI|nr:hypothetical protein EZV62_006991 [Acer yangbiense]
MVEIVISVVGKFAEYLVAPRVRQLGYLCNYKSNFESLKKQVDKLVDGRERVQHLVDDVKRKGEEIEHDVEKWLISVNKIVDEAGGFLGDEEKSKKQCFKGLCPNLKKSYQLSRKAVKVEKMWLTSVKGYEAFESRISTLKDILIALSSPDVKMIGVYGLGGVGKTTLVKEVARQAKRDKIFDVVVFAVVSQTPDIRRIQGEIADDLGLRFSEESESGRARRLCARLKKEKKILVVLDDIWMCLDLETVGIPSGEDAEGCKILLTSRSRDVLSSEMNCQNNFLLDVLKLKETLGLFKMMAGDHIENDDLRSIAIDVSKECAGMQAVLYSTIELSYNYLDSEELKSTFLLCSLIWDGYNAFIPDLLKHGIGLGLFKGIGAIEEARDKVLTMVHKLKASCLLLDSYDSERFSMHDVVRDAAISIASRDYHVLMGRNDIVLREWPGEDTLRKCTAIILSNGDTSELPGGLECPQVKFFYMHNKDKRTCLRIPDKFFTRMAELRVLDLTRMHLCLLPSSLHLLMNLQALCLNQCMLKDVAVIGDLKNLKILSFSSSEIKKLPAEIGLFN